MELLCVLIDTHCKFCKQPKSDSIICAHSATVHKLYSFHWTNDDLNLVYVFVVEKLTWKEANNTPTTVQPRHFQIPKTKIYVRLSVYLLYLPSHDLPTQNFDGNIF